MISGKNWIQNKFDGSRSEQAMMASQYLLYHGVRGNKYYTGETRNKNKKTHIYIYKANRNTHKTGKKTQ